MLNAEIGIGIPLRRPRALTRCTEPSGASTPECFQHKLHRLGLKDFRARDYGVCFIEILVNNLNGLPSQPSHLHLVNRTNGQHGER